MPIDYGSNNVTTSGNIAVSGVVTATSGNFINLLVSGTGVSASGHVHAISDVTNLQTSLDAKVSSITTGITGADQITNMVSLTQAEYDAITTVSATTFYVITD